MQPMQPMQPSTSLALTVSNIGTRRRLLAGAGAMSALMTAAGCGQIGGGEARPDSRASNLAAQRSAQLEVWVHGESHAEWQKRALEDFNREKGFSVSATWTKPAGTLVDKLVVTLAAGSGFPDLADIEVSHIGKVLKSRTPPLVSYDEYLKGKEQDFFRPSAFDPWSAGGKYYGLGNELNVCLMAYRHDLFERAGIKTPIATWEDLVVAAKKVTAVAPRGMFLLRVRGDATGHVAMLAVQAGGGFLTKDNRLVINDANNVRALQFLVDLVHRHQAASIYTTSDNFRAAINTGQVAGELGPTWQISGALRKDAPDTGGHWMVQQFPQWSTSGPRRTTSWGGTGMTVLRDSKYREIGVDFVIWEHTTRAILHDFDLRQVWPTYKKVYDDPRLNEPVAWFNNQRLGPVLKEAAETMLPFFQGVWWPEVSSIVGKHFLAALRNEVPVRQALEQAQGETKAAVEAAGGRVAPDGRLQGQ